MKARIFKPDLDFLRRCWTVAPRRLIFFSTLWLGLLLLGARLGSFYRFDVKNGLVRLEHEPRDRIQIQRTDRCLESYSFFQPTILINQRTLDQFRNRERTALIFFRSELGCLQIGERVDLVLDKDPLLRLPMRIEKIWKLRPQHLNEADGPLLGFSGPAGLANLQVFFFEKGRDHEPRAYLIEVSPAG